MNTQVEARKVPCPTCGEEVDVDGPLEDMHFVFAVRRAENRELDLSRRSNLGTCPKRYNDGVEGAARVARVWSMELGGQGYYYQGEYYR